MNRRRLIIIVAVAVLVIIGIIIAIWLYSRTPETSSSANTNTVVPNTTNTNTVTNTNSTVDPVTNPVANTTIDRSERQAITSVSTSFTERFGSYSSDTNFENIERSRYLMTEAMSKQGDKIIQDGQSQDGFSSVDSVVAGVTITDYADGATGATVEVSVRQTQRVGEGSISYNNTQARLTLKKEGTRWLVDSFRWL